MASTELKLDSGDRVPNFVLPDVTGQNMMLYDMVRGGPIVLCFIPAPFDANRPAVRDLLRGLMNFQEDFEALSAEIYVVTEGSVDENAGLAKKLMSRSRYLWIQTAMSLASISSIQCRGVARGTPIAT